MIFGNSHVIDHCAWNFVSVSAGVRQHMELKDQPRRPVSPSPSGLDRFFTSHDC